MNWLRRLSKAADEVERLAEGTERLADAQREVNAATVNVPGPTLLDSGGRRLMGPLAKGDPFADPARGGQGTSSTSPGYNTGAGTGGAFFDPGGVNSRYNSLAEYQRSIRRPAFLFPGPGRGGFKLPPDPDKTELVSYDGSLTVTVGFVIRCLQAGTCTRRLIAIPGVSIPVEMFDLTLALNDARAIFPTAQLDKGSKQINPAGGGGKGATSSSGGGGGGMGFKPFAGPSAPPGSGLPTVYQPPGGGKLQVAPPTEPTPGERAIVQAIRDEAAKTRQQARSDGGTALRAAGLG